MNGAVVGLILLLTSYLLLSLVNPQLVTLRIPFINPVTRVVVGTSWCSPNGDNVDLSRALSPPLAGSFLYPVCGWTYALKDSGDPPRTCLGDVCDPVADPENAGKVCAPLKDEPGQARCISPKQACEDEKPDDLSVDAWCDYVDDLITQTAFGQATNVGCAKTSDSFARDDCTAGPIINCPTNFTRVDCSMGVTSTQSASSCWDQSKPRTKTLGDHKLTCQSLVNERPVQGAEAICCFPQEASKVYCGDAAEDDEFMVAVPCSDYAITDCSKTCFIVPYLQYGNDTSSRWPLEHAHN